MKGAYKMKKVSNIIRLLLYFVLGYLLFTLLISFTQYLLSVFFSNAKYYFGELLKWNFKDYIGIYTILYLFIYVVNYMYITISVKRLNYKLKKIKKGGK